MRDDKKNKNDLNRNAHRRQKKIGEEKEEVKTGIKINKNQGKSRGRKYVQKGGSDKREKRKESKGECAAGNRVTK